MKTKGTFVSFPEGFIVAAAALENLYRIVHLIRCDYFLAAFVLRL